MLACVLAAYPIVVTTRALAFAVVPLAALGVLFALLALLFRVRFAAGALFALAVEYVLVEVTGHAGGLSIIGYAVGLVVLCELLFWSGYGNPKSAVADWQRSLRRLFVLAGVEKGHAHRFRDTFAVALLDKGVPLETVAILLGNTIRIAEKHYAPWVRSRQIALEDAVRKSWS